MENKRVGEEHSRKPEQAKPEDEGCEDDTDQSFHVIRVSTLGRSCLAASGGMHLTHRLLIGSGSPMSDSSPDLEHVDIGYVANLARLALSEDEMKRFQGELDTVVAYIHKLDELDLTGVEPMSHPQPRENVLREDEHRPGPDREALLENAPSRVGDLVKVPQMMEDV